MVKTLFHVAFILNKLFVSLFNTFSLNLLTTSKLDFLKVYTEMCFSAIFLES